MTAYESELSDFRSRLASGGLAKYAEGLANLARPGVVLTVDGSQGGDQDSRLGGLPWLAADARWPASDAGSLNFLAQVNLAEVAPFDSEGVLPPDGHLAFFYAVDPIEAWGFDPADKDASAVIYTPADAAAALREPPADLDGTIATRRLKASGELTFAPWESYDVEALGLNDGETSLYAEVLDGDDEDIHRLVGHADYIQGDMQLECQLASNGRYCGDSSGFRGLKARKLRPGAADWRLLMQIASEDSEDEDMMWDDMGRIYYWIRHDDLVARRWDTTWAIVQSY